VAPEAVWQVCNNNNNNNNNGGRHSNLKFNISALYQSAEIWEVEFQENH